MSSSRQSKKLPPGFPGGSFAPIPPQEKGQRALDTLAQTGAIPRELLFHPRGFLAAQHSKTGRELCFRTAAPQHAGRAEGDPII